MTFLQYILGATSVESPVEAPEPTRYDDEIYPVHTFDDPGRLEVLVTSWTMCFNDVLDEDKIHKSLAKLLEIGDWRKAGGRLRQKVKVGTYSSNFGKRDADFQTTGKRAA